MASLRSRITNMVLLAALVLSAPAGMMFAPNSGAGAGSMQFYIVQGSTAAAAAAAVAQAGGTVGVRLGLINGVAATLDGAAWPGSMPPPVLRCTSTAPCGKPTTAGKPTRGAICSTRPPPPM